MDSGILMIQDSILVCSPDPRIPHTALVIDCCFTAAKGQPSTTRYDSDSFQIAIDNCAISCFTNNMEDFDGTPTKVTTNITGIEKAKATFVGTARWMIVDNQG
jgi:hypothetical protein